MPCASSWHGRRLLFAAESTDFQCESMLVFVQPASSAVVAVSVLHCQWRIIMMIICENLCMLITD